MAKQANPFEGMFDVDNVLTKEKLRQRKSETARTTREKRLAALGPQNTLAMQVGEAFGELVRTKMGHTTPEEDRAQMNSETYAAALDRATARMEEEGVAYGSTDAQRVVLEEQLSEAFRRKNMEIYTAASEQMAKLEERELQLAKLKADTQHVRVGTELNKDELDSRPDQRERERERVEMERRRLQLQGKDIEDRIMDRRERRQITEEQMRIERDKLQQSQQAAAREGSVELRKTIDKQLKDMDVVPAINAYKRAKEAAKRGTAQGDIALTYTFLRAMGETRFTDQDFKTISEMKNHLLDEVRKGNLSQRIWDEAEKYLGQESFTDFNRARMVNTIGSMSRTFALDGKMVVDDAMEEAIRNGLSVDDVLSGTAQLVYNGVRDIKTVGEEELRDIAAGRKSIVDVLGDDSEDDDPVRRRMNNVPKPGEF